jgi:short-subunit dehydrogenase
MSNQFQRVFITGASSGLGEGLAAHYGQKGATIGLVARREEKLIEIKEGLEKRGAKVCLYANDVSNTEAMKNAATDFVDKAGGIDLVVANAGLRVPNRILEGDASGIAHLFQVNLIGVTNTIVPFVPTMIKAKAGVLCAISSVAGYRGLPQSGPYCASKAAVKMFMDALRMDLYTTGVHAMTICPGYVTTPMTERNKNMIFLLNVDRAVQLMAKSLARRDATYTYPWQMRLLKEGLKIFPEGLIRKFGTIKKEPPRLSE